MKTDLNKNIFILLFVYLILKPSPTNLFGDMWGLKIFDMLVFIFSILIFLYWSMYKKTKRLLRKDNNAFKISLLIITLFGFWTLLAQNIAVLGNFSSVIVIQDLFELYRYFSYVLLFYLAYVYTVNYGSNTLINYFGFATIISIVIAILQYFNFGGVRSIISWIYTEEKLRGIESTNPRVFGSFYNANWFGVHLSIFANYYLYMLLNKRNIIKNIIYVVLGVFGIYISGSRTGIILFLLGFLIIFIIIILRNLNYKKILILITLLILLKNIFEFIVSKNNRINELYTALVNMDFSNIDSFTGRIESAYNFKELIYINPISGIGYSNALNLLPHNSFLLILIQFGIIGATLFTAFWIFTFIFILIRVTKSVKEIYLLGLLSVSLYCVSMFTGEYINSIQLASVIFIVLGAVYGERIGEEK